MCFLGYKTILGLICLATTAPNLSGGLGTFAAEHSAAMEAEDHVSGMSTSIGEHSGSRIGNIRHDWAWKMAVSDCKQQASNLEVGPSGSAQAELQGLDCPKWDLLRQFATVLPPDLQQLAIQLFTPICPNCSGSNCVVYAFGSSLVMVCVVSFAECPQIFVL